MIEFKNIAKRFGKLEVLKGIDLELELNQAVAIIGPNGSGKTTLLKNLLGLVVADKGSITIEGSPVIGKSDYRKKVGYMSQISRFPENITICELFGMMKDLRQDVTEYDYELYEVYKLDQIAEKRLGTLSGGTKQKVSSSLAFLFKPDIIILDEPTAGLDPVATEIIKQKILKEKTNGKLIIITSHIMSDIEELADNIVYIIEGKIQFYWSVKKVEEYTGEHSFSKAMAKITKEHGEK